MKFLNLIAVAAIAIMANPASACDGVFGRLKNRVRSFDGPVKRLIERRAAVGQCQADSSGAVISPEAYAIAPESTVAIPPVFASNSLAQQRAEQQAAEGVMRHVGPVVGGRYEGVGFSTSSPDHAIRSSCYWGQCQPAQIGVARGSRGWYSTVIYK
jgi:hypothetical protein